ncbi:phospholipase A2-like, partial [Ruditapes philippinarum]|uniref:phospholipase A2-like n=1 Tax=Ruditapes philippinarum TaxID=129788 RepID=UPI00295AD949
ISRSTPFCLLTVGLNNGMVIQFGNMIKKTSRIPPLSFNGYGNYCGMFGSGREMDNIDRCCSAHDKCLSTTNRFHCLPFFYFSYYILPYSWYMQDGHIQCAPTNTRCAQGLCDCDRLCAECFAKYDNEYNPALKRRLNIMG